MIKILKKLNILLNKKQKSQMCILLFMMLIGAILEAASIALIIPVITLVISPDALAKNAYLQIISDFFNFRSQEQLTIFIMLMLVVAFILKNIYLYIQQKFLYSFIYTNQFDTSQLLMKNYISKDYEYYLNADTAVIQRNITSDVNNMYALILAILTLVSEVIIFIALTSILFVSDASMTLLMSAILIVTLLIIKKYLKPILKKAGEDNQDFYSGLFKHISQIVTGIKEIKVTGREYNFINEYKKCGKGYVNAVQKYSLLNNVPRLLIETVFIIAIIIYMMIIVISKRPMEEIMPILSAFALSAARLMPCANRINNQLNNMAYFEPFFMGIDDNLKNEIKTASTDFDNSNIVKMPMNNSLELQNITYAYPNTDKNILSNANLTVKIGSSVGVIGTTGSGKSTLIDILLGLLNIKDGMILVDGVDIYSNYQSFVKNVGYIPQMIFMLDDTIRRNVAFGISDKDINEDRIWEVLKEAQLDEFIKTLPNGLDTTIGERGIRLSGGQRQRIGIARALYHDPELLILDEATSALDNDTESAIMDSINNLHGRKTLIIIAHRLQTIEKCDVVYKVENEKITKI